MDEVGRVGVDAQKRPTAIVLPQPRPNAEPERNIPAYRLDDAEMGEPGAEAEDMTGDRLEEAEIILGQIYVKQMGEMASDVWTEEMEASQIGFRGMEIEALLLLASPEAEWYRNQHPMPPTYALENYNVLQRIRAQHFSSVPEDRYERILRRMDVGKADMHFVGASYRTKRFPDDVAGTAQPVPPVVARFVPAHGYSLEDINAAVSLRKGHNVPKPLDPQTQSARDVMERVVNRRIEDIVLPAWLVRPPGWPPARVAGAEPEPMALDPVPCIQVPDGTEFDCRLCNPSKKSSDTARVRFESDDVERILDTLAIDKNTIRRRILRQYWDPEGCKKEEVIVCLTHVEQEAHAMRTGRWCDQSGQFILQEEQSIHNYRMEFSNKKVCLECWKPLGDTDDKVLQHMHWEHGFELNDTEARGIIPRKFECPFKHDQESGCWVAGSFDNISNWKEHLERHKEELPIPTDSDDRLHQCFIDGFKDEEAKKLHFAHFDTDLNAARARSSALAADKECCCPLCGSLLWSDARIDGVKVDHFALHRLVWTPLCRFDRVILRRGEDATEHFRTHHTHPHEPTKCNICPPDRQCEDVAVHSQSHLIMGFSLRRGQQYQGTCDNARAIRGLPKK